MLPTKSFHLESLVRALRHPCVSSQVGELTIPFVNWQSGHALQIVHSRQLHHLRLLKASWRGSGFDPEALLFCWDDLCDELE